VEQAASAAAETGRSEQRRQAIIQAATQVFLQHGYLGATTDGVAARASVSKQTLYKHFADKERLFAEIIMQTTIEVAESLVEATTGALHDAADVREALRKLADGFLRSLLDPDVLRLRRLIIAEADRFPEVGQAWYERGFNRTLTVLGDALSALAERGLLHNIKDPILTAYQFAGLVMYQPMNQVMFAGSESLPSPKELDRIAESAVDVFLAHYGRPE
jgi:TetR/AcrR family transcriptional regulator, mexJK operon transcriptional repressor